MIPDREDGTFLATAFVKAPGLAPGNEDWTPRYCQTYGWLFGQIHALVDPTNRHLAAIACIGTTRLTWVTSSTTCQMERRWLTGVLTK